WLQRLEANDVPVVPLYNVAEVLKDPQVRHLDLIEEVSHSQAGKLQFIGGAVSFHGIAKKETKPPPLAGEHSTAILKALGYDQTTIDELARMGIVGVGQS